MTPKVHEVRPESFRSHAAMTVRIGSSIAQAQPKLMESLSRLLSDRFVVENAYLFSGKPGILFGLPGDHVLIDQAIAALTPAMHMHMYREGYVIDVATESVVVAALSPAGLFYGAQALMDLVSVNGGAIEIAGGRIVDWPTMSRRGFHYLVKSRAELPDFEDVITRFMPSFRLNEIILEINYRYEYGSHPEIREADCWTADDCRRLRQLADENCVKIIPMINCLGHQSWAGETFQLLNTHPEFDETPDIPLSNKDIYCRSWCPLHPGINAFIFDLIDELVDVFGASSFHAGMDEVFILSKCPRCREIAPAELFARSVKDIHAHVVGKHGLEMLIWGDRLIDTESSGYGEWEASSNNTAPAIDLIPKDIVICDWHYETEYGGKPATYTSVREFQKKGLRVWPAGWKSAKNAQMLAEVALESASDLMVGYLATTWTSVGAVAGGLRGDKERLAENYISGIVDAIHEGSRIAWEGAPQPSGKMPERVPERVPERAPEHPMSKFVWTKAEPTPVTTT